MLRRETVRSFSARCFLSVVLYWGCDILDFGVGVAAGTANEAVLREVRDYIDSKGQAGVDYLMCTCLGGINKRPWQHVKPAAPTPAK